MGNVGGSARRQANHAEGRWVGSSEKIPCAPYREQDSSARCLVKPHLYLRLLAQRDGDSYLRRVLGSYR
jgi:hypothetical protein